MQTPPAEDTLPVLGEIVINMGGTTHNLLIYQYPLNPASPSVGIADNADNGVRLSIHTFPTDQINNGNGYFGINAFFDAFVIGQAHTAYIWAPSGGRIASQMNFGGPATLTLTEMNREGSAPIGQIAGEFEAQFCPSHNTPVDLCSTMIGTFDTQVYFEDF
ncbi:MAG: hypothetical protein JKX69_07475 [Rhodobacteraceae bacterium]|nr:hypothetical protein [Paracoccaceae bacterium]